MHGAVSTGVLVHIVALLGRWVFIGGYVAVAWLLAAVTPLDLAVTLALVCAAAIVVLLRIRHRDAGRGELTRVGRGSSTSDRR